MFYVYCLLNNFFVKEDLFFKSVKVCEYFFYYHQKRSFRNELQTHNIYFIGYNKKNFQSKKEVTIEIEEPQRKNKKKRKIYFTKER